MKILLVHPGASWATADVEAGLRYGLLRQPGVEIVRYRLDARIDAAGRWLNAAWRRAKKRNPDLGKPTIADVFFQAGIGALEMALRHQVDVVLVVSAMFLHPDVIILMRRAGLTVTTLFTESPYDVEKEQKIAALVQACWTNERTSVEAFLRVTPNCRYLPHAWHPLRHTPGPQPGDDQVPSHDVVFVGSAFTERVQWLSAVDWTGIDLGLYGSWSALPPKHRLRQYVRGSVTDNQVTAALYRRAKIGLNLYRRSIGWGRHAPQIDRAESLNPRAYELAACGCFFVQDHRAESDDVFGDLVPSVRTPQEASSVLRSWLADEAGRLSHAARLPASVAESSWVHRAAQVYGDLTSLLAHQRAA